LMTTVLHLLAQKGYEICSISPDDSVFDAIKMMAVFRSTVLRQPIALMQPTPLA